MVRQCAHRCHHATGSRRSPRSAPRASSTPARSAPSTAARSIATATVRDARRFYHPRRGHLFLPGEPPSPRHRCRQGRQASHHRETGRAQVDDCVEVQKAVEAAKVRTCVCFECRFSSQMRTIRSIVDRGLLGRIHYGEVDYYHGIGPSYGQFRWNIRKESAGSSLLSAGCHALDALLLFMGKTSRWSAATRRILSTRSSRSTSTDDECHHPQVQGWPRGQGGLCHRLPPTLLLPRASRGQRRQPARQQVLLTQLGAWDKAAGASCP